MAKRVKASKAKTPQQVAELQEAVQWKLAQPRHCTCGNCDINHLLYSCVNDALLWVMGDDPQPFVSLVNNLKKRYQRQTKDQCAHTE